MSLSPLIQTKECLIKRFIVFQGIYQNLERLTFSVAIFLYTDSANYKNILKKRKSLAGC